MKMHDDDPGPEGPAGPEGSAGPTLDPAQRRALLEGTWDREFIDMTPQRGIWTNFIWSLLWLVILLVGMGMITDQVGAFWDVVFALMFGAIIAQLWHLMTQFDDASTRQRMWNKMRGKSQSACPHGFKDWDDCPDCCH